jgi:hypothetical protein
MRHGNPAGAQKGAHGEGAQSKRENPRRKLLDVQVDLAPRVGLEPTTCGLTVRRSTD